MKTSTNFGRGFANDLALWTEYFQYCIGGLFYAALKRKVRLTGHNHWSRPLYLPWTLLRRVSSNHMHRLNSGIRIRHNFFVWAVFLFEKLGTDSVNYADSGDIKILVWFPGSSILKFSIIFWKCVGGAQMRRCNMLRIAQCVNLITPVIFTCKITGTYLILP